VSSMLDPEVPPSQSKEVARTAKGCFAVFVAAAVLVLGGYFVWDKTSTFLSTFGEIPDYPGPGTTKILVDVPEGASLDVIGGLLVERNVIKSKKAWDRAVRTEERATSVQAGRYLMKTEMKSIDALRLLINPGSSKIRLQFTIPEGLRLTAQVDALVKGTKIKKSAYKAALEKPKTLKLPKYAKQKPEGFLFPDTYELTADSTATSTLKQMVDQYNAVTREIEFEADAKKLKRKPYEVLIVASIIEREVRREEDRAKVARVIYNRLDKDRKLELDSTVTYAENLKTTTTTKKDRQSKSKYNTYRYKGLPPGPISGPGKAALEAAANPEKGKWLYFVTVNLDTGETKFADKQADFEKIRLEFQTWCQSNPGRCES
jgi:UPF0755 protein